MACRQWDMRNQVHMSVHRIKDKFSKVPSAQLPSPPEALPGSEAPRGRAWPTQVR